MSELLLEFRTKCQVVKNKVPEKSHMKSTRHVPSAEFKAKVAVQALRERQSIAEN